MPDLPFFRAEAHIRTTGGTTATITRPATVRSGDWGILVVATGSALGVATLTAPPGWATLMAQTPMSASGTMAVYAKRHEPGDADPVVTSSAGQVVTIAAAWWARAYNVGVVGTRQDRASAGTQSVAPGITVPAGSMVVCCFGERGTASGSMTTVNVGPNAVQRSLQTASGVSCPSSLIAEVPMENAGSTNNQTATYDDSSPSGSAIQLSLAPLPANSTVVPANDTGATTTGWTAVGSGASFAARLADNDDTTFAESGTNPSASVFEIALPNVPVPSDLSTFTPRVRLRYTSGSSGSAVLSLYQGATLIHTETVQLSTSWETYTMQLGFLEAAGMTQASGQWQNLKVRVTATATT